MDDITQLRDEAKRGRFLAEHWRSTIGGIQLHDWIDKNALRLGGITAAVDWAINYHESAERHIALPLPAALPAQPEQRAVDGWHDEAEEPTEGGWYAIERADGSRCVRGFGDGQWWIPLKGGWLSGLPAGFRWRGPIADMGPDTGSPLGECELVQRAAELNGVWGGASAPRVPEAATPSQSERDAATAALVELVAVKDLKERAAAMDAQRPWPVEVLAVWKDYERRKPLAWAAARAVTQGSSEPDEKSNVHLAESVLVASAQGDRWIPVSERLPERAPTAKWVRVLAWDGHLIATATCYGDTFGSVIHMHDITHWMSLPPPPARFPDRPDAIGVMIGAHIGSLKSSAKANEEAWRLAQMRCDYLAMLLAEIAACSRANPYRKTPDHLACKARRVTVNATSDLMARIDAVLSTQPAATSSSKTS